MCTHFHLPITKLSCREDLHADGMYPFISLEKLKKAAHIPVIYTAARKKTNSVPAESRTSEHMFLKQVTLSTLFLFALWYGLRVLKLDYFRIKLNMKTCFKTVPNVLHSVQSSTLGTVQEHVLVFNLIWTSSSSPPRPE